MAFNGQTLSINIDGRLDHRQCQLVFLPLEIADVCLVSKRSSAFKLYIAQPEIKGEGNDQNIN